MSQTVWWSTVAALRHRDGTGMCCYSIWCMAMLMHHMSDWKVNDIRSQFNSTIYLVYVYIYIYIVIYIYIYSYIYIYIYQILVYKQSKPNMVGIANQLWYNSNINHIRWLYIYLGQRKPNLVFDFNINHISILQLIGLREKIQEHPMIFMGKSDWFPVKIFP